MKKILYIAIALSLSVSCFHDDRLNDVVQDFVGFSEINSSSSEELNKTMMPSITICSGHYSVGISKSGRNLSEASVTVSQLTDLSELGPVLGATTYALPSTLVTFSETSFHFAKDESVKSFVMTWNPDDVTDYIAANPGNYVIPLELSGSDLIKDERKLLVLNLLPSDIKLATFSVKDEELDTDNKVYDSKDKTGYEVIDVRIVIGNPNRRDDLAIEIVVDNDCIDSFQTTTGNYYNAPPEGVCKLHESSLTIKAGETQAHISLIVDNDKLGATHPGYVVPLRIKSTSMPLPITREIFYVILKPIL